MKQTEVPLKDEMLTSLNSKSTADGRVTKTRTESNCSKELQIQDNITVPQIKKPNHQKNRRKQKKKVKEKGKRKRLKKKVKEKG